MRQWAFALAGLVIAASHLGATGVVEEELTMKEAVGREIVVTGVLGTYGNEPVTFLGLLAVGEPDQDALPEPGYSLLIPDETLLELTGPLSPELQRWQGNRVEIRGALVHEATGPGMPARVAVTSFSIPDR